jgi:alkylation response protein AidB-like acyl-CoA dehydrogenase
MFGTAEQKQRFLPGLADGSRLSAFALTEPCAGSDLTALRTTARREGDHYVVNGEKLFITNVVPGRTIGLVCLIENEPAVLVVELPREENDTPPASTGCGTTRTTGHHLRNPRTAENLLPPRGDGLTIAYHGLNLGRVALCANAAGTMRLMMASMIPWALARTRRSPPEFACAGWRAGWAIGPATHCP